MKSTERAYLLRVIRVVLTERRALPVYPDKQTSSASVGKCQRCHKPTSDQIDPTTICHKCRTRETQFAGG